MGIVFNAGIFAVGPYVVSFNTRTGEITLLSQDVIDALGYTPANGADYLPLHATADNSEKWAGLSYASTPSGPVGYLLGYIGSGIYAASDAGVVNDFLGLGAGLDNIVTAFNSRKGAVVLLSSDVIDALGYTPADGADYLPLHATADDSTLWAGLGYSGFVAPSISYLMGYIGGGEYAAADASVVNSFLGLGASLENIVISFNTRTGAITLLNADVVAAVAGTPVDGKVITYNGGVAEWGDIKQITGVGTVTPGTGMGTGGTVDFTNYNGSGIQVGITIGGLPGTNGLLFNVAYTGIGYPTGNTFPTISPANAEAAAIMDKIYVAGLSNYNIDVDYFNGPLVTGTQYMFNIQP